MVPGLGFGLEYLVLAQSTGNNTAITSFRGYRVYIIIYIITCFRLHALLCLPCFFVLQFATMYT